MANRFTVTNEKWDPALLDPASVLPGCGCILFTRLMGLTMRRYAAGTQSASIGFLSAFERSNILALKLSCEGESDGSSGAVATLGGLF